MCVKEYDLSCVLKLFRKIFEANSISRKVHYISNLELKRPLLRYKYHSVWKFIDISASKIFLEIKLSKFWVSKSRIFDSLEFKKDLASKCSKNYTKSKFRASWKRQNSWFWDFKICQNWFHVKSQLEGNSWNFHTVLQIRNRLHTSISCVRSEVAPMSSEDVFVTTLKEAEFCTKGLDWLGATRNSSESVRLLA